MPEAIRETEQWLDSTIFPIWWDNLEERGQRVYRRLLAHTQPVERGERLRVLGETPTHWIEVFETTGIARVDGDELLPRGELFRIWTEQNHGLAVEQTEAGKSTGLVGALQSLGAHELETEVVITTARWARVIVEYPTMALKSSRASGNQRLLPEYHFQLNLLMALDQHGLLVEAEALSGERGRSDIKVRWPPEPERRACIEIKIWGRNDYADVVEQILGYAVPEDDFGCVVMIDRQARPLAKTYHEEVLQGGTRGTLLSPVANDEMGIYPAFISSHDRPSGRPIRIYHFLVQLPADGPAA